MKVKYTTKGELAQKMLNVVFAINGEKIPSGTLTAIGDEIGLTRERVRQLMKQDKRFIPLHGRDRFCPYCGIKFNKGDPRMTYCSIRCRKLFHFYKYHTLGICEECGLGFLNPTNRSHIHKGFCDKICFGKHIGKKYGWGAKNYKGHGIPITVLVDMAIKEFVEKMDESMNVDEHQEEEYNP